VQPPQTFGGPRSSSPREHRRYGADERPIVVPPVPALVAAVVATAEAPIAPPQPEHPDGTLRELPPSVALKVARATGHPNACYVPHQGARQRERYQRQLERDRAKAERRAAAAGSLR
jgi:hypothetical protein